MASPAGVEQHALGLQAVAAGAAGLLLVVLDATWACRRGSRSGRWSGRCPCRRRRWRRRRRSRSAAKASCAAWRCVGGQPGVVGDGLDAALRRAHCGQVVDVLARDAVDDARLARVAVEDLERSAFAASTSRQHAVGEVGPVEVADEDVRVAQAELRDDVLRGPARWRWPCRRGTLASGKCSRSVASWRYSGRKSWPQWLMQWASSMAKARTSSCAEELEEAGRRPAVRGRRRAARIRRGGARRRSAAFRGRSRQLLSARGRDAASLQAIHLVLHQGDERRDDDGRCSPRSGGGSLVAERLAAAGGHDDEGVAALRGRRRWPAPGAGGRCGSPSTGAGHR